MSKGVTGLRRLMNAFRFSLAGLRGAFAHEDAFRQELLMACLLVPAAMFLGDSRIEKALLIASVLLVLIVELLNSALQATVDRISLERHARSPSAPRISAAPRFF